MPIKYCRSHSCVFRKNTRRNSKTIHICAGLQLKVTAVKNSGPTPSSAGYPSWRHFQHGFLTGEGGGGKLCQPPRSRVCTSWKTGKLEPPFSHHGERKRKMNEGGWGGRFVFKPHTYRCAESRAMQHPEGRGYHAGISNEEGRGQRRESQGLTQNIKLKRNIMYFKQQRQPLAMLHFLNSRRKTKDRSR